MDSMSVRVDTGNRAMQVGDFLTAQGAYATVLQLQPDNFKAALNMAMALFQTNRLEVALKMMERALKLESSFEGHNNYGWMLAAAGRFQDAEEQITRSLELVNNHPVEPNVWHTLGMIRYQLGRWDDAIKAFDKELSFQLTEQQKIDAIDQRGLALLGAGRYTEGLIDNKARWSVLVCHPLMHSSIPQWQGEDLTGKSICVLHEQGDGDTFQFVRFVPMLRQKGAARIVLSVPDRFHRLFRNSNLADEMVGIKEVPDVDYICPMLTVPAYFNLGPGNIPKPAKLEPQWNKPQNNKRKTVGLVWAGKPMYAADQWRSMPLQQLLPLMNEDCRFVSLQAGDRVMDLHETGMIGWIEDLSPQLRDWNDTAGIMSGLDLLISVDTAPAHLAASLGVPVALLVANASCWRWGDHDRDITPWYPSMHIFRQFRQGDWSDPVTRVKHSIRMGWLDGRR
jgi:hypothetical protein